jgi:eukaryotic-like serine/threonine-protein kinase
MRIGRGAALLENVLQAEVAPGHCGAAAAPLTRSAERWPASPSLLGQRGFVAMARGDYAAGARLFGQLRAAQRASPGWQAQTSFVLARVSLLTGRIREAERYLRENMDVSEARGALGDYLGSAAVLARLEVEFHGRADSGLAVLDAALARHPLERVPALDRSYPILIATYARLGRVDEARRLTREYESAIPEGMRRGDRFGPMAAGALADAEHRPAEASAAYRTWHDSFGECNACGLFELAHLADQAGRTDSAIALYDRGIATPALMRVFYDSFELPAALKRSGELYEAKGDRARAAERYRRFVDLWKDADPELQPGVREVRVRLARLSTEPGT